MAKSKYLGEAYCPSCKKEVDVIEEDVGIGSYEFWGQKGCDTRLIAVCAECNEEIEDFEWPDSLGDRADHEYERQRDEKLEKMWEEEQADPKETERY